MHILSSFHYGYEQRSTLPKRMCWLSEYSLYSSFQLPVCAGVAAFIHMCFPLSNASLWHTFFDIAPIERWDPCPLPLKLNGFLWLFKIKRVQWKWHYVTAEWGQKSWCSFCFALGNIHSWHLQLLCMPPDCPEATVLTGISNKLVRRPWERPWDYREGCLGSPQMFQPLPLLLLQL